jgi:nitrate/nitrite transporter NarK
MQRPILIGIAAGVLGFFAVARLKLKLGYDDSLDAFGVHGMCGTLGALATGLFADPAINAAGTGLFFGNPMQVVIQLVSILATAAFTARRLKRAVTLWRTSSSYTVRQRELMMRVVKRLQEKFKRGEFKLDQLRAEADSYAVEKSVFRFSLYYLFLLFGAFLAEAALKPYGLGGW